MRYTLLIAFTLFFAACGNDTTHEQVNSTDSTAADSIRQAEEDEMSKEIIEGSFDALNR